MWVSGCFLFACFLNSCLFFYFYLLWNRCISLIIVELVLRGPGSSQGCAMSPWPQLCCPTKPIIAARAPTAGA